MLVLQPHSASNTPRSMWAGESDNGTGIWYAAPQQLSSGSVVVFDWENHDEANPFKTKRTMGFASC